MPYRRRLPGFVAVLAAAMWAPHCVVASGGLPEAVGLEARGVDPQVALRYARALDVRDADNRPVSVRLIEQQIQAGQSEAGARAGYASRLPRFRDAFKSLERLMYHAAALRGEFPWMPRRVAQGLPRTLRLSSRWLLLVPAFLLAAAGASGILVFAECSSQLHPPSTRPLVLRC